MTRTEMGLVTDRSSVSVTGEQRLLTPEEEAEGKALDEFVKKFHNQKRKEVSNGQWRGKKPTLLDNQKQH